MCPFLLAHHSSALDCMSVRLTHAVAVATNADNLQAAVGISVCVCGWVRNVCVCVSFLMLGIPVTVTSSCMKLL